MIRTTTKAKNETQKLLNQARERERIIAQQKNMDIFIWTLYNYPVWKIIFEDIFVIDDVLYVGDILSYNVSSMVYHQQFMSN